MIYVIDNYDSFVYNIVQHFGKLGAEVVVRRNDETTIEQIERAAPRGLVISPGPSSPSNAGISSKAVEYFAGKTPILGVCLGHQCIGEVFGGKIRRAIRPMHGKLSTILHDGRGLFAGVPPATEVVRYHSLVVDRESVPDSLEISAMATDGEVMGLRHRRYQVEGVQFHPESIFSPHGFKILENFLELSRS